MWLTVGLSIVLVIALGILWAIEHSLKDTPDRK
ncbi:hypothetical protein SAMN05444853_10776 [Pasteurella skyensis]|uniref:Uncharacterized protein n=1 Tax=Phocoenobacter skyensis TaxID=97481 RepID=A0A1H7W9H0_9PAST|nr:hypothetical protein SAMN05444853_10776 [Pasteurella skyensis]